MKKKISVICISTMLTAVLALTACGGDTSDYSSDSAALANDMADYADYSELSERTMDESAAESQSDYDSDGSESSTEEVTEEAADETESKKSDRKLITTVDIVAETNSFDTFIAGIEAKTEELGGYAESTNIYGDEDSHSRTAYYTLRIPAEKADSIIEEIDGRSNITSRSKNVEDVTLTYVDIASKKDALQTEYDRLNELLESAESVDDLITIEERMSEVRYEIESIESQLRTYDNKINYTTLNLTVEEVYDYTETPDPDPTYWQRLSKAMSSAMSGLGSFLQNFSIFILVAIPVIVILAIPVVLIVLLIRFIVKKIKNKKKKKNGEEEKGSE